MKTNPVYKRECMVSARSFRLALVLLVFNGILALVALLNMYSALAQVRLTAEVQYTGFLDLYMFVASLEFLMQRGAGAPDAGFDADHLHDTGRYCAG